MVSFFSEKTFPLHQVHHSLARAHGDAGVRSPPPYSLATHPDSVPAAALDTAAAAALAWKVSRAAQHKIVKVKAVNNLVRSKF